MRDFAAGLVVLAFGFVMGAAFEDSHRTATSTTEIRYVAPKGCTQTAISEHAVEFVCSRSVDLTDH